MVMMVAPTVRRKNSRCQVSTIQRSFGYGLSQWEKTLLCNVFSHWLIPCLEWSSPYHTADSVQGNPNNGAGRMLKSGLIFLRIYVKYGVTLIIRHIYGGRLWRFMDFMQTCSTFAKSPDSFQWKLNIWNVTYKKSLYWAQDSVHKWSSLILLLMKINKYWFNSR